MERIKRLDEQKKNVYEILGITSGASQGEIKTAYIKIMRQVHPDKNPDHPHSVLETAVTQIAGNAYGKLKS